MSQLRTVIPLLALLPSPTAAYAVLDSDGDGIIDTADALPCDASASAVVYAPAEGQRGMLLFEDLWPESGDLDFNDLAVTCHYQARLNSAGAVVALGAVYDVLSVGGILDTGLALRLPLPR